jgi:hypothetical protein
MSQVQYGHQDQLAMSLLKKEATFNAGVAINDTNACSMHEFGGSFEWEDRVDSDKSQVTGREHGTGQQIIGQGLKGTYTEEKAKPNSLAGLGALVMGNVVTVQDGAFLAYRHTIAPGANLPSISVMGKKGGLQYTYDGVKGESFELRGEEGSPASLSAEVMGSGKRTASATTFPAKVLESWLLLTNCKVWLESGANVVISSPLIQDAEDISNATPEVLGPRMLSYAFRYKNNLRPQHGFGGAGVLQDIQHGRRSVELELSMLFVDNTELNYYLNQDRLAIEFDLVGGVVAVGGAYKFGYQLVVPTFKLKKPVLAEGGVDDSLLANFQTEVFEDGTNPVATMAVYNAKAAYLAA